MVWKDQNNQKSKGGREIYQIKKKKRFRVAFSNFLPHTEYYYTQYSILMRAGERGVLIMKNELS